LSRWLPDVGKHGREGEFQLAQHLVDHGVFLHPGEEHCKQPGWFRLVFSSMPEADLKKGIERSVLIILLAQQKQN
jgi:1-aminocyclopropane-1-carboxylate synthase